jgi:glycosyltransferase involved in cell wall biosynthesis
MTVAFDVSYIQRRASGIGRYSLSLLREILLHKSSRRYILHGWSYSLDERTLRLLESDSVRLSVARIPGMIKRTYWDRLRTPSASSLIGDFDIFHSMDPFAPPVGQRAVIVTVYDVISHSHPQFFTKKILARDSHIPVSLRRAAAVFVPSRFTQNELAGRGWVDPSLIHVVPPSIPGLFNDAPNSSDGSLLSMLGVRMPFLLFVGTLEPRKNIPGLLRAFEAVCDRGHAVDLVLAGNLGWMSNHLPASLKASRHASKIRHLGYVTDESLAALYRNALCFVYPSFIEGYGLPVVEAMASGVPVVTSDSSGMAEITGEGALLIDPNSHTSLTEALDEVISLTSRRETLKASGLRQASILRRENGAAVVARLYDILGGT